MQQSRRYCRCYRRAAFGRTTQPQTESLILIYWISRSRLREDFAQFCLLGSLTVPLATCLLVGNSSVSDFLLYCTYFYFNRIFWLVSNSLARRSLSGLSVRVSMSVCSQQGLGGRQCESSEQSSQSLFSQSEH